MKVDFHPINFIWGFNLGIWVAVLIVVIMK